MKKILYAKSFSGDDHDAVLNDYKNFYNTLVDGSLLAGATIGDPRTEFMVTPRTLHESPMLTIVLRVYEK